MPGSSETATKTAVPKSTRKRAKHTRSRLGCGVCRIRKVRCDRIRPYCDRCTKTGRTCDGYPAGTSPKEDKQGVCIPGVSSFKSTPSPIAPLKPGDGIHIQRHRSIIYFQSKTALEFSGYFHNDLWSTLVLQVSHREECVRKIVIALGLLHECFHLESANLGGHLPANSLRQQAISRYIEAVTLLNSHIAARGWAELEVTLLCSILCVAFEWLRGDYKSARKHLRSTLSIITEWQNADTFMPNRTSFWSPSGHLIRKRLKPLCTSLVLQARTIQLDLSSTTELPLHPYIEDDVQPFSTLQEAKHNLDITLASIAPEAVRIRSPRRSDRKESSNLALRLTRWSQYFDEFLTATNTDDSAPQITIMRLWLITARILFTASISEDERDFDRYLHEFQYIVDKVEVILTPVASYVSVDIGVLPLLYYVALKCRQPDIRHRAIALLEATPRREAVWDSVRAARIVREIASIEEAGLGPVSRACDVPDSARVCMMHIVPDLEHRRIHIKTKRQGDVDWGREKALPW